MKIFTLVSMLCLASLNLALPTTFNLISGESQASDTILSPHFIRTILPRRQSCFQTCGSVCYDESTITNATAAGFSLYKAGDTKGDYPHTYNNYEGFDFNITGPYQEYPVLKDFKAYTGGSPGADRVIFNTKGSYAGTVTHTGASGDNFVACK